MKPRLKQQFEDVEVMFEGQLGSIGYDELCDASNKCEKIAEDFAIDFYEWRSTTLIKNIDQFTNKEAMKIFKEIKML